MRRDHLGVVAAVLGNARRGGAVASPRRSTETNPYFAELTGRIAAPAMAIHESADFRRVPFRLQQDYR